MRVGRPRNNHAGTMLRLAITAAIAVARLKVAIGSPLTFTRTFQVPWNTAATRDMPTAIAINVSDAPRAGRGAGKPLD